MSRSNDNGCGCLILIIIVVVLVSLCSRLKDSEERVKRLENSIEIQD